MKYNVDNLDYLDFEKFCCSFMNKYLCIKMRRYREGKDGGIDISNEDKTIVCQCKRYNNFSNLLNACKEEAEKIENKKFNKYYLLTSYELSEKNHEDLRKVFTDKSINIIDIIDGIKISDYLDKSDNKNLLLENPKLWFFSSSILSGLLNKYENSLIKQKLIDIDDESKYFVETEAYHQAIEVIGKKHVVLITGDPGIGKTITSDMIVKYLLLKHSNSSLIYGNSNTIREVIQYIEKDDEKAIIYIDDFLGQTISEVQNNSIYDLKMLINIALKQKNKKLILNSRISIYNKAASDYIELKKIFNTEDIAQCFIDTSNLTLIDKTRILYNQMYINNVPYEYYINIKKNKNYNKIINHRSFNSRIIEYCCLHFDEVVNNEFLDFIIKNLDNPREMWKNEFNRLGNYCCNFLYILYSLGQGDIPKEVVKNALNHFLYNTKQIDENCDFVDAINILSNSLIKVGLENISILNPSINDYIQNYLLNNSCILDSMYENCTYIEQLIKIGNLRKCNYTLNRPINDYKSYNINKYIDSNVYDKKIKIDFIYNNRVLNKLNNDFLKSVYDSNIATTNSLNILFDDELSAYYNLKGYIENLYKAKSIFSNANEMAMRRLFIYYSKNDFNKEEVLNSFSDLYIKLLNNEMNEFINGETIEVIDNMQYDDKFIYNGSTYEINRSCFNGIYEMVYTNTYNHLDEIKNVLTSYGYSVEEIFNSICFGISDDEIEYFLEKDLEAYQEEIYAEDMAELYREDYMESNDSKYIDMIFNQEYKK